MYTGHYKAHDDDDFPLTFHSNDGPTSNRFRDRRRFQPTIAKFPTPVHFTPPFTGFPLELSIGARDQKPRMMGLSGGGKTFEIGLAV